MRCTQSKGFLSSEGSEENGALAASKCDTVHVKKTTNPGTCNVFPRQAMHVREQHSFESAIISWPFGHIYYTQLFLLLHQHPHRNFLSRLELFSTYYFQKCFSCSSQLHSALVVTATLALGDMTATITFIWTLLLTTVAVLGRGTLGFLVGPASLLELWVSLRK